ncbi:MAG: hypothetical protein IPN76_18655 [Saprospiraceae bacterium]|nr:hypothetical protein [Saprospiraceae bacterium]
MFNVGQGDNILLRFPDGSFGFIDFYYDEKINFPKCPPSLLYAQQHTNGQQPKVASLCHISHYHFDHLKGFDQWAKWVKDNGIEIRQVWLPGALPPKTVVKRFAKILKDNKLIEEVLVKNPKLAARFNKISETYGTGLFAKIEAFYEEHKLKSQFLTARTLPNISDSPNTVKASCISPSSTESVEFSNATNEAILLNLLSTDKKKMLNGNNISAVLHLTFGPYRLLFGGDALKGSFEQNLQIALDSPHLVGEAGRFTYDFVKLPHHGSAESSSGQIWCALLPNEKEATLAISAGVGNYGHPDMATLEHIKEAADSCHTTTKTYATNYDGLPAEKQQFLEHCTDIMPIDWPTLPAESLEKRNAKEAVVDIYLANVLLPNKKNNPTLQKLGYCFEFDPNGLESVKVLKLLSRIPEMRD